jgi:hypothetical protein
MGKETRRKEEGMEQRWRSDGEENLNPPDVYDIIALLLLLLLPCSTTHALHTTLSLSLSSISHTQALPRVKAKRYTQRMKMEGSLARWALLAVCLSILVAASTANVIDIPAITGTNGFVIQQGETHPTLSHFLRP